jgi:dienelactone hydrolase
MLMITLASTDCLIGASDIFGPQTLQTIQGADILHHLTGATIYVPDFFHGVPFPTTIFPPRSPEQVRELQVFFEGRANIDDNRDALVAFGTALRERFRRRESEEGGDDASHEESSAAGERNEGAVREDEWEKWVRVGCYGISWGAHLAVLSATGPAETDNCSRTAQKKVASSLFSPAAEQARSMLSQALHPRTCPATPRFLSSF